MLLSSRNEWIAIAVLIAYLAFVPSMAAVRDILSTPIGKAAALAGIMYVYKFLSRPVALLLIIAYVRCAGSSVWEGVDTTLATSPGVAPLMPATPPTCTPPMKWDDKLMMCTTPPLNVNAVSATASTAAPAIPAVAGPLSTAPMTIPGAGMPTLSAMTQPNVGGVQGVVGAGTSSVPAVVPH
jgi:hypothetical protein